MNKKIAWIFPGQGAQYVGMGKDFAENFAVAREAFQEADDRLGEHLSKVIFEGPEEALTKTYYSQLGILVASVALLRVMQQQLPHLQPVVCAGLSLGEYTALVASSKMSFAEALFLVRERARWMQEACEQTAGGMAAVLGLGDMEIEAALQGMEGVWVANYNTPGQLVISGASEALQRAAEVLKAKGAKRVLALNVHGAFHSGLMRSAQEGLRPWVGKAALHKSDVRLVMNVPGALVEAEEEMRTYLIEQVVSSVRWHQSVAAMRADLYVEIGPGKTLTGMNRKIGVEGIALDKLVDLDAIAEVSLCSC